jgi:predicted nucleotidyltransferase
MFADVVSELSRALRELGVRWVLIGAVAANLYRRQTRLTADVDLLLADVGTDVDRLESAFRDRGWRVRRATPVGDVLRMQHAIYGSVDLQIAGTDYQREAIRRARIEALPGGIEVAVLRVEDVLIHKLIAGRNRDLDDIESILESGVALDEAYLDRWIEIWEVRERWSALRAQRGGGSG